MISKFIFMKLIKNSLQKERGIADQLYIIIICTPKKNSEDLVNDKTALD